MSGTPPELADFILFVRQGRRSILTGAFLGLLFGLGYMGLAVPHYGASMILSPTTRTGTPDISALFPDNASFAMEYVLKSFGPGDSTDFVRFEHIVREPSVAALLLKDPVITNGVAQDRVFRFWPGRKPEDPVLFARYLQNNVTIASVGVTPLRRLSYTHPDPEFAVYLLNRMHGAADGLLQAEMRDKADNRIMWLSDMLTRIANEDHRRTLTGLLMDQEQIRMILALNEPFAARVAEPASSLSSRPSWPRWRVVVPFCAMLGAFAGALYASYRRSWAG